MVGGSILGAPIPAGNVPVVKITASTDSPLATDADTIAIGVFQEKDGPARVSHDLPSGELAALLASGEASPRLRRVTVTHHDGRRVLLAGLGPREEFDGERARLAAAAVHARARELGAGTLCWELPHRVGEEIIAGLITGTVLAGYRFTRFKPAPAGETPLERLVISAHHDIAAETQRAAIVAAAQNRARDLANTPANVLTPAALAQYAGELATRYDALSLTVLDRPAIEERGMGAFAAVAQGTEQDARLIELRYDGATESSPRLALLGKAVTFDTGGLALKPAAQMMEMKFDMCGGAAVLEAIAALAEMRAPVRVFGIVGAVENFPGPHAVRPGDIVTALDGTTIQVDNPDAEGRMVLADCITHARREGCDAILDVATLTGAVQSALGWAYAGVMSNDDALCERVIAAGRRTGELVWRLPLHPIYAEQTAGRDAVLTNRPEPRVGLASAAAEFLHHFAGDQPWAHLDMLAVAYKGHAPYLDKGGTGWGVRLLCDLALEFAG